MHLAFAALDGNSSYAKINLEFLATRRSVLVLTALMVGLCGLGIAQTLKPRPPAGAVCTGIVEFAGGDAGDGIRDVRGGCGDLSEQHAHERPHGRDCPVVAAIRARWPLSGVSLWTTA